jgi:hypothetical protein
MFDDIELFFQVVFCGALTPEFPCQFLGTGFGILQSAIEQAESLCGYFFGA